MIVLLYTEFYQRQTETSFSLQYFNTYKSYVLVQLKIKIKYDILYNDEGDKMKIESMIDSIKKIVSFIKQYLKTNILFITFVISSVINSCILRFVTVKNYFDIRPVIADLALVVIVGAFGYFLKPKHQFRYYITWSIIFTLTCLINSIYYTNFLSYASFSLLKTSLQVIGVTDAVVENIMELKDFCYIWQIVAMVFVHKKLKKRGYYDYVATIEKGKIRALNTLVVGLIFIGMFISTLTSTDISRLNKQWNREYLVMRFGIYAYQTNDLVATLKAQINPLFGYDEHAKAFREFYDTKNNYHETNSYTNALKGMNVIVIHAESIQQFVLDTEFNGEPVAPNLKRLANEGLYFSNFYAQESVGTSSDSEFTFNTSLMPASSGTVFVSYFDREYVTIPKLLKQQGYYTFSMHGNNGSFWNRLNAHKSLGYDKYYNYKNDFEIDETIGLGLSDKSFFHQAVPKIKEISEQNKNFYGVLIMLTNHTPFSDITGHTDYEVNYKYQAINPDTGELEEMIAPYMEGTKLGNYFKSVHYADEALGQFLAEMDAEGLLENTAIVIYGDHDAKLKKSEYKRFYNYVPETDSILSSDDPNYKNVDYYSYELNRKVPFIIWTKNKNLKGEVTKVMGMYDVLPTLGNMMGFQSPYALGHDIFSVDENVVVFPDGNWLTDKMYYNQSNDTGKLLNPDDTVSVEYMEKYTKIADQAISISDSIIIYDLIRRTKETQELLGQE